MRFAICLVLTFSFIAFGPSAHADATKTHREALFKRAFSSTAYILQIASYQQAFIDTLTDEEGKMLVGIIPIAQEARNHEWAEENKIYRTAQGASAYVFHGNYHQPEERALLIDYPVKTNLVFSADQSNFKVREDEEIRTATTRDGLNEPIFVNTEIINQPSLKLKLSDAVQILVHEFGHKLGPQKKIQGAVDSLAAKIKTFVDSHTTQFRLSNGTASITKFSESIYEDWHETTLQGRYVGVNIPNQLERFKALSDEGLYVLLESSTGVTDITSQLLADLANDAKFEPYKGLDYRWIHFRQYSIKSVQVREFSPGKIRLEVDGTQAQTAIPFLVENDLDPVEYRPWARVSQKSELGLYSYQRFEWTLDTKTNQKLSVWTKPLIFEDATPARHLSVQTVGNDLVYQFEVPRSLKIQGSGVTQVKAFLIASLGNEILEVEGERAAQSPTTVTFRFKNAATAMKGTLKPLNIEVESETRNLARPFYVRSRLFLDRSESTALNGSSTQTAATVKSHSVSNGNLYLSLNSASEISGLRVLLELQRTRANTSRTSLGSESHVVGQGTEKLTPLVVSVSIPSSNLKQDLVNGVLQVAVDLNHSLIFKHTEINDITPADLPGHSRGMKITEESTTQVSSDLKVLALEVQTQSGKLERLSLVKNAFSAPRTCIDAFTKTR